MDAQSIPPHANSSSAKAVRKQLVADGEDADRIKEERGEIDQKVSGVCAEHAVDM